MNTRENRFRRKEVDKRGSERSSLERFKMSDTSRPKKIWTRRSSTAGSTCTGNRKR
jgi:hypothetical protein